jgi:hypothetical protein
MTPRRRRRDAYDIAVDAALVLPRAPPFREIFRHCTPHTGKSPVFRLMGLFVILRIIAMPVSRSRAAADTPSFY